MLEIIQREPTYDGSGVVFLLLDKESTIWDFDLQLQNRLIDLHRRAWPAKAFPSHVCCPSKAWFRLFEPTVFALMDKERRARIIIHNVPEGEMFASLALYGIEKYMLPTKMGGTVELNVSEWIEMRRAIEMEEIL
jgi:hypothetical protein